MSTDGAGLGVEPLASFEPSSSPTLDQPFWETLTLHRLNPLVAAAAALLGLCAQLKIGTDHVNVEELRLRVLREIDVFERRTRALSLPVGAITASKYALCATIDDIVLNTAWGSQGIWAKRSMVGTLFGETWGGDRFFELLEHMKKGPAIHVELLELLYYCMRVGFEGRFRVTARGTSELSLLCEDAYRLIRAARGDFERDISPHWKERVEARRRRPRFVPTWAITALGVASFLSLFVVLQHMFNERYDVVLAELAALPPSGAVRMVRATLPDTFQTHGDKLRDSLGTEISDGSVTVTEDAQQMFVAVRASGMFDSASSIVNIAFVPLLLRIGRAINEQPGEVILTGHTDSMPIDSLAYRSNEDLSVARAKAAAETIKSAMREPGRVREQGGGSDEPIASNRTPQGRAKNRRIEIIIKKPKEN
ncbi:MULTISPECIES: type IVB secretion system protein IcmH/DotU [unclassified Rhizobium]|uniref:type IVB secretion system protein IcmH/DotU n=1 Tax=unclassified Rhizobium TaxID=2613769 RepID=UPI00287FF0B0|nr:MULTISPECIES: type IVB secretion system protein IcmH/DotU [unclassified Rhizobium]